MEIQQNQGSSESKFNIGFFFLSLGVLVSLITCVTSFLNLVFETLNKRFPDVLNASYEYGYSTYQYEGIRMALATLIIFFPVLLVVSYFWRKMGTGTIGYWSEIVKKWLIYIVLFLSSVVAIVDLVTLVKYFISGEVTTRFVLKVLTVLVVVGLASYYFISILRAKGEFDRKFSILWGSISGVLVLGAVVWSFTIMGSPMEQRKLRLDDRRVGDLQNIQYQVINYWQQKEALPKDLEALKNPLTGATLPVPPEFEKGEVYEYNVKSKMTFELCATFALPMPQGWQEYGGKVIPYPMMNYGEDMAVSYPYPGGGTNESWDHEAGRTCFERTIDPDIYPPFEQPVR